MTRDEWVDRCAARMTAVTGIAREWAIQLAQACADTQAEMYGASGQAWESPEDAADEEMSYWDADEGEQ